MFNLIHTEAIVKVDFVVRKDTPYHREEFGRRRQAVIDGHPVWIVSAEDSILFEAALGEGQPAAPYFEISSSVLFTSVKSAESTFAAPGSPGRDA